jgi:hypothetical protein
MVTVSGGTGGTGTTGATVTTGLVPVGAATGTAPTVAGRE